MQHYSTSSINCIAPYPPGQLDLIILGAFENYNYDPIHTEQTIRPSLVAITNMDLRYWADP